jgi:hypothetical protein
MAEVSAQTVRRSEIRYDLFETRARCAAVGAELSWLTSETRVSITDSQVLMAKADKLLARRP